MTRVLLVDDQELVRAGLRGILRPELGFEVVGEAADGRQGVALALAPGTLADVVLMDVRMPVMDGVEATRQLKAVRPELPVLALTTFDDDETLAGMLHAGASGFVLKGAPAEDIHRAVRSVAGGGAWLDPDVTARVLAVYRAVPGPTTSSPPPGTPPSARAIPGTAELAALASLTGRELDVLTLMAKGLTNTEIARHLVVSEGTVKTHVNHLFAKLGLRDRTAAVILAYGAGLVQKPGA